VTHPRRILVVDDEPGMLALIREVLEGAGYMVATLDRSTHVPEAIQAHAPDLLILDYMMPDRSGPDVIAELALLGVTPRLLLITALPVRLTSLEHHAILTKPFDTDDLVATVARIIGAP